jgi:hypothetical protein
VYKPLPATSHPTTPLPWGGNKKKEYNLPIAYGIKTKELALAAMSGFTDKQSALYSYEVAALSLAMTFLINCLNKMLRSSQ